ncbi:hypothetical protein AAFF_G00240430 [Aldrovandia affinis]|uniref:Uncharacterized protein n=1 Tax=Aldrovandia affinis TaxID=143900 RepID=A0AAD7SUH8_9TELE|nr:hypothetical protein AAFF_G00240430 [Aldrovandia affinis]
MRRRRAGRQSGDEFNGPSSGVSQPGVSANPEAPSMQRHVGLFSPAGLFWTADDQQGVMLCVNWELVRETGVEGVRGQWAASRKHIPEEGRERPDPSGPISGT